MIDAYKKRTAELLAEGDTAFLKFFHDHPNLARGQKVWTNQFEKFMPLTTTQMAAIEIGYGAGGILLGSSRHFKKVVGVEIHGAEDLVTKLLVNNDCGDFELKEGDGMTLPVRNNFADLIFSWTAFQHFGHLGIIQSYLHETRRALKKKGIAVYYFGRMRQKGIVTEEMWLQSMENEKEGEGFWTNPDANVNQTNLTFAMWKMKEMAEAAGLKILVRTHSGLPTKVGGQHGVVLCQS